MLKKAWGWLTVGSLLMILLGGCSGYSRFGPKNDPGARDPQYWQEHLFTGDNVRLTLRNGERITGTIDVLDEQGLQFLQDGNYGFRDTAVAWEEVAGVELRNRTDGQIEGTWMTAIITGLILAPIIIIWKYGMGLD